MSNLTRRVPRSLAARLGHARRQCALNSGRGEIYDRCKYVLRRVLDEVARFRELTDGERWWL